MFSLKPHLHTNKIFKVIIIANIQNRNKYLESNLEKIIHSNPGNYHKRWEYSHLIAEEIVMPTEYYTDTKIISKETQLTLWV